MFTQEEYNDFMGREERFNWAIGVVEEAGGDPLGLGRVKVRWFGIHPEEQSEVPTQALPWAQVLRPATNWQMPAVAQNDWVVGFFADGKTAQYPIVLGIIGKINRPSRPTLPGDGSYVPRQAPFWGQGQENPDKHPGVLPAPNTPGVGAVTGDSKMMIVGDEAVKKYCPEHASELLGKREIIHLASYQLLVAAERLSSKQTITPHGANDQVGRLKQKHVSHSMHYQGRAFDVQPGSDDFVRACVKVGFTGFGFYKWGVHVDTGNARCWGPTYHFNSVPPAKLALLKSAGWSPSRKPFQGIATNPGQPQDGSSQADSDAASGTDQANGSPNATYGNPQTASLSDAVAKLESNNSPLDGPHNGYANYRYQQFPAFVNQYGSGAAGVTNYAQQVLAANPNATFGDFYGGYVTGTGNPATAKLDNLLTTNQPGAQGAYNNLIKNSPIDPSTPLAQVLSGSATTTTNPPGFYAPVAQNSHGADTGKPAVAATSRGWNVASAETGEPNAGHVMQDLSGAAYGGLGGFARPGGEEPFSEPVSGLVPTTYDMVSVFATKSHPSAIVVNDVAGAETILVHHGTTGSKIEMGHDGTDVYRTRKDLYQMAGGDVYHGASGDYHIGAKGSVKVASQDLNMQTDGSMMFVSFNDGQVHVSGKYDVKVGEVAQFKATRIILEAQNFNIFASQNLCLEAGETISMRSKNLNIETSGDTNHLANGKYTLQSKQDMNISSSTGKYNVYSKGDMSLKSEGKLNSESTGEMNIKSDDHMFVESSDDMHIKSDAKQFIQASSDINLKSGGQLKTNGASIHVVSNSNLVSPPWVAGGTAADAAQQASTATKASDPKKQQDPMAKSIGSSDLVVAIRADSTNLGKPSEKTNINQDKVQSQGSTSLISGAGSVYTA